MLLPGQRAGQQPGTTAPDHGADSDDPLIVDLDATVVTAHSAKQDASPSYKREFGFRPLCAFVDRYTTVCAEP